MRSRAETSSPMDFDAIRPTSYPADGPLPVQLNLARQRERHRPVRGLAHPLECVRTSRVYMTVLTSNTPRRQEDWNV